MFKEIEVERKIREANLLVNLQKISFCKEPQSGCHIAVSRVIVMRIR